MAKVKIIPSKRLPWGDGYLEEGVVVELDDSKAAQAIVDCGFAEFEKAEKRDGRKAKESDKIEEEKQNANSI